MPKEPSRILATRVVASPDDLRAAINDANPGDRIEIVPGDYVFSGNSIEVSRNGTPSAPITVAASRLGDVKLRFDLLEGFVIRAPYWRFENLVIVGACGSDSDCEHAFHVVGAAQRTNIRNNVISDFNAHIKVNGQDDLYPDGGIIEDNTLVNTRARQTSNPVTPIDLVAASDWSIRHNLIADFMKLEGDATSYGGFAKGGGSGNQFDANVVLCEYRLRGVPGKRVGLSIGGGGSINPGCRNRQCVPEQDQGVLRNNLVAFCSDDGIYLNRAFRSEIVHNTILDTAGITARWPETTFRLGGNLIDGAVRIVENASVHDDGNRTAARTSAYLGWHPVRRLFLAVSSLDLQWAGSPPGRAPASGSDDLCGQPRGDSPVFGAFEDFGRCIAR
jgi:hypothetical protein